MPQQPCQVPHRPGPLHQTNKAHKGGKSRPQSVSQIKTKAITKFKPAKTNRAKRLQQANQLRQLKEGQIIELKRKIGTEAQPPLLIGVLDLELCKSFFNHLKDYPDKSALDADQINDLLIHVKSHRFKKRFTFVALDSNNFDETLDLVKCLDLLILSHKCDAQHLLRAIRIHCLPTTIFILDAKDKNMSQKDIAQAKKTLEDEKLHVLEKDNDFLQLFHKLANCKQQPSVFKDCRPQILTEKVEVKDDSLIITGFIRKKLLSANDLIHIIGYDDYQIKQIDILRDPVSLGPHSADRDRVFLTLRPDLMLQETLEQENQIDPMEGEQNWPTTEELALYAEEKNTRKVIKKLPKGTSTYQGAWIGDSESDIGDSSSNEESDEEEDMNLDKNDQDSSISSRDDQESVPMSCQNDEAVPSMEVEENEPINYKEKELKILEKLKESRIDSMFPDEVDTPFEITARMRFARYRGLKSFRTSDWDPQENLPPDFGRIYQFQNFQQTKRRVMNETPNEGADPGQYVRLHLANVPGEIISTIVKRNKPLLLIGLLKHERKMTIMNLLIKRLPDSNLSNPIRSKEELIFYVGFRKFKARPLFSDHSSSTKFKSERFLRDDVACVATVYAPITFPPASVLVFRQNYKGEKELVASGSILDYKPNRLIIKRIRLAGHPFKIHSKTAVIRFMFFNSEDVMYFKPVELITRYSRRGHIVEPIGTHGHMKCTFDKKIRSDDCIFMNLYKRMFPKWTYAPILNSPQP